MQFLNIKTNEKKIVGLLFLLLFVFSFGAAFARSIAMSLLVGELTEKALPYAFILVDFSVMLGSIAYVKMSKTYDALKIFNVLLKMLFLVMIMSSVLLYFSIGAGFFFVAFSAMFILITIHISSFIADYLNIAQLKRLSALIYSGLPIGGMIGGMALIVLLQYFSLMVLMHMLTLASLIALIVLFFIARDSVPLTQGLKRSRIKQQAGIFSKSSWHIIRHSKIVLLMILTTIFLVLVSRILEYLYQGIIYPSYYPDIAERTIFFGKYEVIANFISLVVQLFLGAKFINRFGVAKGNMIYPFLQLLGSLMLLIHFGFIAAIVAQFVNQELRTTIRSNANNLLFNAIARKHWPIVKAFISGFIYPVSTLCVSLFLLFIASGLSNEQLIFWLPVICIILSLSFIIALLPLQKLYEQGVYAQIQGGVGRNIKTLDIHQSIVATLHKDNEVQLVAALTMVTILSAERYVHPVGKLLLHSKSHSVKRQAAKALVKMPHDGPSLTYMGKALKFEGDPQIITLILKNLLKFKTVSLDNTVNRFLLHPQSNVFSAAVLCLHENQLYSKKARLLENVLSRMTYASDDQLTDYLRLLGKMGKATAYKSLINYAQHSNTKVRVAQMQSLYDLGQETKLTQQYWIDALFSKHREEQRSALCVLQNSDYALPWQDITGLFDYNDSAFSFQLRELMRSRLGQCEALLFKQLLTCSLDNYARFNCLQIIHRHLSLAQKETIYRLCQQQIKDYLRLHLSSFEFIRRYEGTEQIKNLCVKSLYEQANRSFMQILGVIASFNNENYGYVKKLFSALISKDKAQYGFALEVLASNHEKSLIQYIIPFYEDGLKNEQSYHIISERLFAETLVQLPLIQCLEENLHPQIVANLEQITEKMKGTSD